MCCVMATTAAALIYRDIEIEDDKTYTKGVDMGCRYPVCIGGGACATAGGAGLDRGACGLSRGR